MNSPHGDFRANVEQQSLLLVGRDMYFVIAVVDWHVLVVAGKDEVSRGLYL